MKQGSRVLYTWLGPAGRMGRRCMLYAAAPPASAIQAAAAAASRRVARPCSTAKCARRSAGLGRAMKAWR